MTIMQDWASREHDSFRRNDLYFSWSKKQKKSETRWVDALFVRIKEYWPIPAGKKSLVFGIWRGF